MAKNQANDSQSVNLLGTGTTFNGDIESDGDFRIDGKLTGSIVSKGKIVIGATGVVEGEIVCQNADISGNVKAKLEVRELISLKASAVFSGDIKAGKLAIEPGAQFSGSCQMNNSNIRKDQKK